MNGLTRFVGTASLAAAMLIGGSPSASAAVACVGTQCDGKDPNLTGCASDPRTYALETKYMHNASGSRVGKVELRWSPTCQATWSRVESFVGSRQLYTHLDQYNGGQGISSKLNPSGTVVWSTMKPMISGRAYRAYGEVFYSDKSGKWSARTRYYGINWV